MNELRWDEMRFQLVAVDTINVSARDVRKDFDFGDMGLRDGRMTARTPDKLWDLLVAILSQDKPDLSLDNTTIERLYTPEEIEAKKLTSDVKRLGKALKECFNCDERPFGRYDRKLKEWPVKFFGGGADMSALRERHDEITSTDKKRPIEEHLDEEQDRLKNLHQIPDQAYHQDK